MQAVIFHCKNIKRDVSSFLVYSGEDELLDESIDAGMDGIISVMAHDNLLEMKRFLEEGRTDNVLRKRLKKRLRLYLWNLHQHV